MRRIPREQTATWTKLLKAILADDRKQVARLLADDPSLARRTEEKGRFVVPLSPAPAGVPVFDSGKSGVAHWFYRGDTALHLCAAAHRVELARRLLRRGAEVNARNFREGTLVRLAVQSTGAAVTADSPAEQREIVKLLSRPGRESESEKLARQNADGWARAESNLRLHWRSSVVPRLVSGVG